jgi:hypothetical protein
VKLMGVFEGISMLSTEPPQNVGHMCTLTNIYEALKKHRKKEECCIYEMAFQLVRLQLP